MLPVAATGTLATVALRMTARHAPPPRLGLLARAECQDEEGGTDEPIAAHRDLLNVRRSGPEPSRRPLNAASRGPLAIAENSLPRPTAALAIEAPARHLLSRLEPGRPERPPSPLDRPSAPRPKRAGTRAALS